ncbi:Centromere-associated protein E Centromere protein E [Channa argus]|uniref:Centromere-associated protein E n=1 Tax=Channa argus TaxID=215402 RepID=A0A6G1QJ01_CHAAH|nr:Centromere-associated protein E Centromere protein E [Channa argus]
MTEESAVKVCVRVRPLIAREESASTENAESVQLFWKADKKSIHQIDDGNSTKSFSFDRVFTAEETTDQLYQDIAKPLVVSTVQGYNGTIFAYGQTSSGKTFTMMGSGHIPGVIPLAVEDVFQTIKNCPKKEFLLRVSYMEIYNETVTDLLVDSWKRKPLEVRETINKNIYVADLTEELVTSPAQALAWIRKGEKNRHYGKTKMNQRSSRSHTIFRMILESRERSDPASGENADGAIIVSHLNLVDLAGSERASQTGAEGTRFKEGCNINRSLFTLGQVIKKVTDESLKGFTNYRDSKLTRILQNSLGGNAKTVIICTITPVTLDETLSTLQFASTAKKMKNDPHVTEVSDDGALLKRYRNEIVDLKRRLHEVSSVTQTTVTEKEVLSQLLQEKDQLQRDQEDRIRNLTKLLVTSSNLVPFKKVPKRRVTWGGKMLRLAHPSACGGSGGSSDLSFAESYAYKRKADRSCLMELGEDDEDFDAQWEIPDEPSDEMEISQSSVTVRSFEDSSKDFVSPDRMCELSGKVSNLELQLEMESQQKEDALTKAERLDSRVAELEAKLQTEAQQKQECVEKILEMENKLAELELQLQTEAQLKMEAVEKVEMLEIRVADLDRQLEEQSHTKTETEEQMRREFAETIQLCETLASEKDMVVAERDYLKQELGMFIEQTESLEKEKAALTQELEEKRDMDEFKSLEEEFRKEHENDLQNEISSFKKALESSEIQCQELQNKLETLCAELKKKAEFAEELQSMSGKDLVQEVATLRRSLDDAEGVSRDTKKEWAVLRSRTMALEELNVTLTSNHEKMEAEVNNLRFQLETEKSRYRKMQSDLQKELNVAFDENTKLTSLLDGKVPKNLIDSVELERTVANLNKELSGSREVEEALRNQLTELDSLQNLPEKVDNLMKQVCELAEELGAVQTQRDNLLTAHAQCEKEAQQLRASLQMSQDEIVKIQADLSASAALKEEELSEQCAGLTQQLDSLRLHLERCEVERSQLVSSIEETDMKLEESNKHKASLEENLKAMQQLVKELEEKLSDSEASRSTEEEISKELQEQLNQLSEELQCVRGEREASLLEQNAGAQGSAENVERLLSVITSLTAERDQLRMDLQMATENQALLQRLEDEIQQQKQNMADLEKLHEQMKSDFAEQVLSLSQELQSVRDEKEVLLMAGGQSSAEELEQLISTVASLSAERDQLKMDMQENVEMMIENQEELRAALDKNHKQKEHIKQLEAAQTSKFDGSPNEISAQLEELQTCVNSLTEELECVRADRDGLLSERMHNSQTPKEEVEKLLCRVTTLSEERDQLQEILEGLRQEKNQLKAELEDRMELVIQAQSGFNQPEMLTLELQADNETTIQLQQEMEQLKAILQVVSEQKSKMEMDLERNMEKTAETEIHLHSLQEQLEQQNKINTELERLSQERQAQLEQQVADAQCCLNFLQEELQEQKQKNSDLVKLCEQKEADSKEQATLTEELEETQKQKDRVFEKESSFQNSTEEMEKLLGSVSSLSEERDQLQAALEGLRQEKDQLKAQLEDRMEMIQQLEEHMEKTRDEVSQLKSDLEENVQLMIENQEELRVSQEKIRTLQDEITVIRCQKAELESRPNSGRDAECSLQIQELRNQIQSLTEELQSVHAEKNSLTASSQTTTEEMEKLLCRVTLLSEERDQLQEILEGQRQEKQQLRAQLEDEMETLQSQTISDQKRQLEDDLQQNMNMASTIQELLHSAQEELRGEKQINSDLLKLCKEKEDSLEGQIRTLTEKLESVKEERDILLSERTANIQTSTEEKENLLRAVTSLSEEKDQLKETLEGLENEKQQLRTELEDRVETLQNQLKSSTENLESVKAERDSLLSESLASTAEMEKLLCRVTSVSEGRDQLQETAEGLRQEINLLKAELKDRIEMVSTMQEKLSEQEQVNAQLQTERGKQEAKLQQEVQQLEEQLHICKEKQDHAKAEADALQQLLSEANATISSLREQLSTLDQNTSNVKETMSSRLQDSTEQLQESFKKFQHFIDMCSKYNARSLDKVLRGQCSLKQHHLTSFPKLTINAYSAVCQLQISTIQNLGNIAEHLQLQAQHYRNLFEELVKTDLAVFEEKRQQDVLLCRAQAPEYSVKDDNFHALWEHRVTELLNRRQLYLQKMASIFETLWANMNSFPNELASELRDREKFKEQLQAVFTSQPFSFSRLDAILASELEHRSEADQNRKMTLQGIIDEQKGVYEELKLLHTQAESQLNEERSKNSTLLKVLEGAPQKKEVSLLKDNQQLVLQLQQTEEIVKSLRAHNKQLEEAHIKANNRVSNHKEATQLLQTELQDSRAQVEEKENTIRTLKSKLRESEKNVAPSAVELKELRSKLFKMEVQLTSASDKHQQEIQRMTTVLNEKEDSLRKLKEALRKSQQQGEESFLQGEDLHARLTNPRGFVVKSSILLEKTKLEEEVKQLQLKKNELENLLSSQQAEISKWKTRAIKLKVRCKADVDMPSSPCTPTKRGLPMSKDSTNLLNSPKKFPVTPKKILDSPRILLDSPKLSLPDSPKSSFFGVGSSSDMLSRSCPKQFFDNSVLGTTPEISHVPDKPDAEEDVAAHEDKKDWWPLSPKQEDMCKSQ